MPLASEKSSTSLPGSSSSAVDISNDVSIEAHFDTCVICLAPLHDRAIAYPCNHLTFDFTCLKSWLSHRPTCPLCNAPVQRVEYDWRTPNEHKTYIVPQPAPSPTSAHTSQGSTRSLRPRRRPRFAPTPIPAQTDLALARRRLIHSRQSYSLHRAPLTPFHPTLFRDSPLLQRKARLFLRRELLVFTFLSRTEFVVEYTVGMMKRLELKGADGAVEGLLGEVLGREEAKLLVHELAAWMGSAFDRLEDWDRSVQYRDPEIMAYGRGGGRGTQEGGSGQRKRGGT